MSGRVDPWHPDPVEFQSTPQGTSMQITPVVLNLTPLQLLALQDAISHRYRQLDALGTDSPEITALRDLHVLMDRY